MLSKHPAFHWHCEQFDESLLAAALGEAYRVEAGNSSERKIQLYDSFERSFICSGNALVRSGGRFRMVDAADLYSSALESEVVIRHHRPVFAWDFEPGAFQQLFRKRLKLRAAVQLATVTLGRTEFAVRNPDGKIVLRMALEVARVDADVATTTLQARPLLGYEEDAESVANVLASVPEFSLEPVSLANRVLELVGRSEPPLSPKDVIQLKPDQSVQDAVTAIAEVMIRVARQSEPGIIEDIDTEYLHDYRVAIRKLRSVISLVKGAYPKEDTRRLKDTFGGYARATNRLRDLDVYLLKEAEYREQLPDCLRPGLDRMFADFRAERGRVIGKVRRSLQSADYMESLTQQQNSFSRDDLPEGLNAVMPIRAVVVKEINKHYKLVRKMGLRIQSSTPDAEVHELRIECKKLRYLLELFASLFDERLMARILKRLRGLQNVLGDFNDYSVQMESMNDYLNSARNLDKISASAVGGLVAMLHHRQLEARGLVAEKFKEFSDGKMRERFEKLFEERKEAAA